MVSNDNIIWESVAVFDHMFNGMAGALPENFRVLSYLPLSHVAAQMLDLVCPLVITAAGEGYGPAYLAKMYYTTW